MDNTAVVIVIESNYRFLWLHAKKLAWLFLKLTFIYLYVFFFNTGKKVFFINCYMELESPEGDIISGPAIKKQHEFFVL